MHSMPNVILIVNCFAITINQMHMCLVFRSLIFPFNLNAYHGQLLRLLFYLFYGFYFPCLHSKSTILAIFVSHSIQWEQMRIALCWEWSTIRAQILFKLAALCNWEVFFISLLIYLLLFFFFCMAFHF